MSSAYKEWLDRQPEHVKRKYRDKQKQWRIDNAKHLRRYSRKYRADNRERINKYLREWRAAKRKKEIS